MVGAGQRGAEAPPGGGGRSQQPPPQGSGEGRRMGGGMQIGPGNGAEPRQMRNKPWGDLGSGGGGVQSL